MAQDDVTRARIKELVVELERLQHEINVRQARQLRLMAKVDADDQSSQHWVQDLVACVLRLSVPTARTRLSRSRVIVEHLPKTLALVESGEIPKAREFFGRVSARDSSFADVAERLAALG
jgi:hypothetical protein